VGRHGRRLQGYALFALAVCTHLAVFGQLYPKALLEVERKFSTPPDLPERVAREGGQMIESVKFKDIYFDTPDALLGSQDVWLRSRDKTFELKVPFRSGGREKTKFYIEEDSPELIAAELKKHIDGFNPPDPCSTPELLKEALLQHSLEMVATFVTKRTRFEIEGLSIDCDQADFGYNVTEVEHLVESGADLIDGGAAVDHINNVAEKLRLEPLETKGGGKLDEYNRRYNPEYRSKLVEAGVVEP